MTYKKGESGNPAGRPKGSSNKALKLVRDAAEDILPKIIGLAKEGDFEAQKLLLAHGLPRLKPVTPPEPIDLGIGDFVAQAKSLLQAVADGQLSPTTAAEIAGIMATAAKLEEVDHLRNELITLKSVLEARKK